MQINSWVKTGRALAMAAALVPAAAQATLYDLAAVFNFENIPVGTPLPFSETVNGLTATFTGEASVCDTAGFFVTMPGNTLIQQYCNNPTLGDQNGPLRISFSSDLSFVSFDFATVGGASTLTVEALENGNPVSTSTFNSGIPPGQFADEGFASVPGVFNMLVLTGGTSDMPSLLAIDNISTPEPASIALLGTGLAGLVLVRRRRNAAQAWIYPRRPVSTRFT
jgi:hypothetical protein